MIESSACPQAYLSTSVAAGKTGGAEGGDDAQARYLARTITENATTALYMMDAEGRCTFMNPAAERLTGHTPAEMLGEYLHELVHHTRPDGTPFPMVECQLGHALFDKRHLHGAPDVFVRKDGTFVPVICSATPILENGELVAAVLEVRDVTGEHRAHEALAASDERLRLAVEAARLGTWDHDPARGLVRLSTRCRELLGFADETVTFATFLAAVQPLDREAVERAIQSSLDPAQEGAFDVEFRLLAQGGEEPRWISACGKAFFEDASRRAVRVLGIVFDVSARKHAEEALKDADRRKDEFLAMLAHELRNPLAPLVNAAALLRIVGSEPARLEGLVKVLDRQLRHMTRLVDELLEVSRISRGKIDLSRETLDLRDVLRHGVSDRADAIRASGLALSLVLPEEPVWVHGDHTRLAQVLANLISNALKFTEAGGSLEVRLRQIDAAAEVSVSDTGIGLAPEVLARIFEPFEQVDAKFDRSRGGLGLGLAVAKGLVALHGGTITAHSEGRHRGTTFRIVLPTTTPRDASAAQKAGEARGEERLRVLVIEDNRDAANTLAELLEMYGHQVRIEYDGLHVAEVARAFRPEIVLCDLGLPEKDGYTVASELRRDAVVGGVRLIAISGYGTEEDRRRSRSAGFDEHLTKPVDPAALFSLLRVVPRA